MTPENYSETREELFMKTLLRKTPMAMSKANLGAICSYLHEHNGGCAIGCDMSAAEAEILEGEGSVTDPGVFKKLPARLQKMGPDFLAEIQQLHDTAFYWIDTKTAKVHPSNGLVWSSLGLKRFREIKEKYQLNIKL